jgi:hypothetical protein
MTTAALGDALAASVKMVAAIKPKLRIADLPESAVARQHTLKAQALDLGRGSALPVRGFLLRLDSN